MAAKRRRYYFRDKFGRFISRAVWEKQRKRKKTTKKKPVKKRIKKKAAKKKVKKKKKKPPTEKELETLSKNELVQIASDLLKRWQKTQIEATETRLALDEIKQQQKNTQRELKRLQKATERAKEKAPDVFGPDIEEPFTGPSKPYEYKERFKRPGLPKRGGQYREFASQRARDFIETLVRQETNTLLATGIDSYFKAETNVIGTVTAMISADVSELSYDEIERLGIDVSESLDDDITEVWVNYGLVSTNLAGYERPDQSFWTATYPLSENAAGRLAFVEGILKGMRDSQAQSLGQRFLIMLRYTPTGQRPPKPFETGLTS